MTEQELMLTSVLKCRRMDLYTDDICLSSQQEQTLKRMRHRRENGEPLQYILGETEFQGLKFYVNSHVLIPRPETELMVEKVYDVMTARGAGAGSYSFLDIGTGSGCIAVSLAKRFPGSRCKALDVSSRALTTAQRNARRHHVSNRIEFIHGDIVRAVENFSAGAFDMIISNPPYIPRDQLRRLPRDVQAEPVTALDGGEDGLDFYRIFLRDTPKLLKQGGLLVCEFWDGQDKAIRGLFGNEWRAEFFQDFSGVNRFFIAQYILRH